MAKKKSTIKLSRQQAIHLQNLLMKPSMAPVNSVSGIVSPIAVWLPKTRANVAKAVELSQNESLAFKSSLQAAAKNDVVGADSRIVINLSQLKKIKIHQNVVKAEAGVSIGDLAKSLADHQLALPLGDNPEQSIVSNLMRDTPSLVEMTPGLMRVTPSCLKRTLGTLSSHVISLRVVTPDGKPMTRMGSDALQWAQEQKTVITEITFKASPANDLWMCRTSFVYPGKAPFGGFVKELFLNQMISQKTDLVLDAFSGRHDIPMVRITAAGGLIEDQAILEKLVKTALANLPPEYAADKAVEFKVYRGADVMKNIMAVGLGIPEDPEIETIRDPLTVLENEDQAEYLDSAIEEIDRGLAFSDDQTGKLQKGLRLAKRLRINSDGLLSLSGKEYRRRVPGDWTAPEAVMMPMVSLMSMPSPRSVVRYLLNLLDFFSRTKPRIPDFKGDIYIPDDGRSYLARSSQYATSSFPKANTTPFMVACPTDIPDIQAAIRYAKANHKRIVGRSGGHQYSGMSSGDQSTIVLSMDGDNFKQFRPISENIIEVGPGVRLTQLAAYLKEKRIAIPHGECPMVCVGGHAQTGGFGHLFRCFGLTLDYVKAFTIVLADGSVRTLNRPKGTPKTADELLFWGVLGGNAGSFGIVISYVFECLKDDDYKSSFSYTARRKYDKTFFRTMMNVTQNWTKAVEKGTLAQGIDFTIALESRSSILIYPILVIDLVQSETNRLGRPADGSALDDVIQASDQGDGIYLPFLKYTSQGKHTLSTISQSLVRDYPATTSTGREFDYPYKKRLNCTTKSLTTAFIQKFVDLVDKVLNQDGIYLVFEMIIGTGKLNDMERWKETSIPRRDFVFCLMFDLFYKDGYEDVATALQLEMQKIIDTEYSLGQDQKLFWGSFGSTDMNDEKVRDCYYDDIDKYKRLQKLKKEVDPCDLFGSSFSVKLP